MEVHSWVQSINGRKCGAIGRRTESRPMSEFLGVPNIELFEGQDSEEWTSATNEIRIPESFKFCATRTWPIWYCRP